MQIQTTAIVISSTSLPAVWTTCMQGSMEIEPCGLGTFEQWGINGLETKVLCMDIQVMWINHLGLLNKSLCSPYHVPFPSVHIQHPKPPFRTCLWEARRLTLWCLRTYHHHNRSVEEEWLIWQLVEGGEGRYRVERKKWHIQQYYFSKGTLPNYF